MLPAGCCLSPYPSPRFSGCRLDMHVQPRYNPYDPSDFLPTAGRRASPWRERCRAQRRGRLGRTMRSLTAECSTGQEVRRISLSGHARRAGSRARAVQYFLRAVPWLGGDGDGMIVQRGFQAPPSYHIDRLRNAPAGPFLQRDHQRFRRDVPVRLSRAAARPLGDHRVHPGAAIEPPGEHRRRAAKRSA